MVDVRGSDVSVDGKALGSDPEAIRAALQRSGYYAFVVRCDASVHDATLGTVLEAAQANKPPRLHLDVGDLSVRST